LLFDNADFDIIIGNHVIDAAEAKGHHFAENRRVRLGGDSYLAIPHRRMSCESRHYLMFLSWCQQSWHMLYLCLTCKASFYNRKPLQMRQLECMSYSIIDRVLSRLLDGLRSLRGLVPLLIYRLDSCK
jgi:hypothetical protein